MQHLETAPLSNENGRMKWALRPPFDIIMQFLLESRVSNLKSLMCTHETMFYLFFLGFFCCVYKEGSKYFI